MKTGTFVEIFSTTTFELSRSNTNDIFNLAEICDRRRHCLGGSSFFFFAGGADSELSHSVLVVIYLSNYISTIVYSCYMVLHSYFCGLHQNYCFVGLSTCLSSLRSLIMYMMNDM